MLIVAVFTELFQLTIINALFRFVRFGYLGKWVVKT